MIINAIVPENRSIDQKRLKGNKKTLRTEYISKVRTLNHNINEAEILNNLPRFSCNHCYLYGYMKGFNEVIVINYFANSRPI